MPSAADEAGSEIAGLYRNRFDESAALAEKRLIWRVLCRSFFQEYVDAGDTVLDLGAGYCEFINEIDAPRRIAVDLNPETALHADPGVEVLQLPSTCLEPIETDSVGTVFVSNFFEHLPTPEDLVATLREVHRVLRPTGRLLILQPNIRLTGGRYWDFLDHRLPLTERSLSEACALTGFRIVHLRTRFLPYTTKSRVPQHAVLVRSYLRLRPLQWALGKQTFMVCSPSP